MDGWYWMNLFAGERMPDHVISDIDDLTDYADSNNPWGGVKRSYFFFSKSGHVAYQIKEEESVDLHAR